MTTIFKFNKELTDQAAQDPKYKAFLEWLDTNGALYPKVIYPAIYTHGDSKLVGVMCKEQIQPAETIMYIPNKCLVSTESARRSEIGEIYRNYEDIFVANVDRDHMTLVLYLMYERSKGTDSFYHPYFEVCELVESPALWPQEMID